MDRRGFLTRSGLALGALVVGDEALEAFARLTHVRKSFPSAGVSPTMVMSHTYSTEITSGDGLLWVRFEHVLYGQKMQRVLYTSADGQTWQERGRHAVSHTATVLRD